MINEDKSIEKVIDAAIASLENSSLVQDKEIIVVGKDALSKKVENIRANYDDLQIHIAHSRASYQEISNKGLFKATGSIIVLLSEDTLLPTDYFDVVIPQFEKTNLFAAGVVSRYPETGESTQCYEPIFSRRRVDYKTCSVPQTGYSLTLDRSNVAFSRDKIIQLGGFNTLFASDNSADIDLFLRGWLLSWRTRFLTATHCDLINPIASPLLRGTTSKVKIEKEYNDVLIRRFFLSTSQQPFVYIHNLLLFIMSIVIPLEIFHATRMAGFRYLKNFKRIISSKRWRYSSFDIDLYMMKQRFF